MNCRNCEEQIIEAERLRQPVSAESQKHLDNCPSCRERRAAERSLSQGFGMMRASAVHTPSEFRRAELMLKVKANGRRRFPLRYVAAIAAMLLIGVGISLVVRPAKPLAAQAPESKSQPALAAENEDGFVEVPYAPPLAQGEFVRVVKTELQPVALARMGFNLNLFDTGGIQVELLVGEDGIPRAVRLGGSETQF